MAHRKDANALATPRSATPDGDRIEAKMKIRRDVAML
jgi:hypothetical protein